MALQVGEHAGQAGDDVQPLAVIDRRRRLAWILVEDLPAGELVEQVEDLIHPLAGV